MTRIIRFRISVPLALALLLPASGFLPPVAADEAPGSPKIAGVTIPGRIELQKQSLVLNGAALRKIALIKIYVAGLYLQNKESHADAILASDAPRSLVMHFLKNVDAKRLCEGWDNSLAVNTPDPSSQLKEQFVTLCSWMENARDGERLAFVYSPGQGTVVEINGKVKGPMAGKEFADALFRTWIGPHAIPGEEFKQKLLGELQ
jgi:hypothetical protein